MDMPFVVLASGQTVQVPAGPDGRPNWSAVGQIAAADPTASPRQISRGDFLRRITDAELGTILAAQSSIPVVGVMMLRIQSADDVISLDDPLIVAALDQLAAAGLLAPVRPAEIRA